MEGQRLLAGALDWPVDDEDPDAAGAEHAAHHGDDEDAGGGVAASVAVGHREKAGLPDCAQSVGHLALVPANKNTFQHL